MSEFKQNLIWIFAAEKQNGKGVNDQYHYENAHYHRTCYTRVRTEKHRSAAGEIRKGECKNAKREILYDTVDDLKRNLLSSVTHIYGESHFRFDAFFDGI